MSITVDGDGQILYNTPPNKQRSDATGTVVDDEFAIVDNTNVLKQIQFKINPTSTAAGILTIEADVGANQSINLTSTVGGNSFTIMQTDLGTSPTADSANDTLTFTSSDDSILITGDSTTDTIDLVAVGGGGGTWGSITGTLSDQVDLQAALDAKEPSITAATSADYWRGDKSFQTLDTLAVPENTNLYYTQGRFDTAFAAKTTDGLTEGVTNLYFTPTRAYDSIAGSANTFTGYGPTGKTQSIDGWTWINDGAGATFVSSNQGYTIPVDGTPATIKINNQEIEWDAANNNTDQSFYGTVIDGHVDRSHHGGNLTNVTGLSMSQSVEGSGIVANHTVAGYTQNLQGDSGGTTTAATTISIGAGAAALYNVGQYTGIGGNFNAQATSVVGDVHPISFGTSGDFTGNYNGAFLTQSGNVGGAFIGMFTSGNGSVGGNATLFDGDLIGDVTGSVEGLVLRHTGNSNGFTGIHVSQLGTPTTTNNELIRAELGNGTSTGKTGLVLLMGGGTASGSGRILQGAWQDGNYDNRIAFELQGGTGDITTGDQGIAIGQSAGTSNNFHGADITGAGTTQDWQGVNINGANAVVNNSAVGLKVQMNGITGLTALNRQKAIDTDGGIWNQNAGFDTVSSHPYTLDVGNTIGVGLHVVSGTPITGTEWAGTTFRNSLQFDDDMGVGPVGLGWAAMLDTPFILGTAGKTVDKATMHGMVPLVAGGTGGTIAEFNYHRALTFLNFGGTTPTISDAYVFRFDGGLGPLSGTATKAHGLYLDDAGLFNYMGGKTRFGGGSYSEPTVELDVTGDALVSGDVASATLTPANGATGSFTTVDLQTVTVTNGIITAIV